MYHITPTAPPSFLTQGKTGPKPKNSKFKADSSRPRARGSRRSRRTSPLEYDSSVILKRDRSPSDCKVNLGAAPLAANTATAARERVLLEIYMRTIGKLVPLTANNELVAALEDRQRLPQAMLAAVGEDRVACGQAQVGWRFGVRGVRDLKHLVIGWCEHQEQRQEECTV